MRDPAQIYTRHGTPIILIASRLAFAAYFVFLFVGTVKQLLPDSFNSYWLLYLLSIYAASEIIYDKYIKRNIDLTFAFPLLLAIFILHFVSLMVRGQDNFPLINRAEHFTTFVLLGYIVWVFFHKYLPQKVWQDHPYYTALLVLSVTSLVGVGNEIFELFFDKLTHARMVGAGYDTSLDLLMNTLGTGLFLAVRLILIAGNQVEA